MTEATEQSPDTDSLGPPARQGPDDDRPGRWNPPVKHHLLEHFYPTVRTLRQHLLSKLPAASRIRRKKIALLGSRPDRTALDARLADALDTTLVCDSGPPTSSAAPGVTDADDSRWQLWQSFSQKADDSHVTLSHGISFAIAVQSEIVDFSIWLLLSRHGLGSRSKNVLCHGFRRGVAENGMHRTGVPGIVAAHPSCREKALKEEPWPQVLALLGQSGQRVMIHLLVDCSLFVKVRAGSDNYYQYTGTPLHDLDTKCAIAASTDANRAQKLSEISLPRSRIFYAKPVFTAKGAIRFGFMPVHAINRFRHAQDLDHGNEPEKGLSNQSAEVEIAQNEANTTKLLMYMFPRQFGLQNVFTSQENPKLNSQTFHDYTVRPDESLYQPTAPATENYIANERKLLKVPKRLRGPAKDLVRRLQILHGRCSYFELLRHHCPTRVDSLPGQREDASAVASEPVSRAAHAQQPAIRPARKPRNKTRHQRRLRHPARPHARGRRLAVPASACDLQYDSLIELACPHAHVSAFCQAVLSRLIPDRFWGEGPASHNKTVFLNRVNHFIRMRRSEGISLHEIAQDFKITDMAWLQPPNCQGQKTSQTDLKKRYELFHEFIYYVFDSLLIPLIRTNFFVTETSSHRLQVFYFRHDVWRIVAQSAMAELKTSMFEELKPNAAKLILGSRRLGFSQLRLLPKGKKMRPITNLRRRSLSMTGNFKGARALGPSINSVLQPVFTMLKHEQDGNPSKLGSTLSAVGDIYERIKSFKLSHPPGDHAFYLAKLDVTAAFDTIPQSAVIDLMQSIPRQKTYVTTRHVEMRPGDRPLVRRTGAAPPKPIRRWFASAVGKGESSSFLDRVAGEIGRGKRNTVFVENPTSRTDDVNALLYLLEQHVGQNIVKMGKKFYRQKRGIPQGSVLSSSLCNYFYADLEARHLDFLDAPDCLLMRLIDDFLLITLDKSKATRFVEVMHRGVPDYGVEVNPAKTMVNFDMDIAGQPVRKAARPSKFPYCGTLINCQTLELSKNQERDDGVPISASLTVHHGRSPGRTFQRKVLHAFSLLSHAMFFDTAHNSTAVVLRNLRGAFSETATKMWAYLRCLSAARRPREKLIIRTIARLSGVAFHILTSDFRKQKVEGYACDIRRRDIKLVAYSAFFDLLTKKQTNFGLVLSWLRGEIARLRSIA